MRSPTRPTRAGAGQRRRRRGPVGPRTGAARPDCPATCAAQAIVPQAVARPKQRTGGQAVERNRTALQHHHAFPSRDGARTVAQRGLGQAATSVQRRAARGLSPVPSSLRACPARMSANSPYRPRARKSVLRAARLPSGQAILPSWRAALRIGRYVPRPLHQPRDLQRRARRASPSESRSSCDGAERATRTAARPAHTGAPTRPSPRDCQARRRQCAVDITRDSLVGFDRDLARTRAQALALLLGQRQPTGVEEKLQRLTQVGLGLAGKPVDWPDHPRLAALLRPAQAHPRLG